MSLKTEYATVERLANTDEAGGLARERAVLLLWFLRNVVGLDDLEAYEYVCDGPDDGGVDGLRLEPPSGDDEHETLVIYQSKYTETPKNLGPTSLDALPGRADRFKSADALREFLDEDIEDKLKDLIERFELLEKLEAGAYDDGTLKLKLVLVTTGVLTTAARNQVEAANKANGPGYFTVYDLKRLGPLAETVAAPEAQIDELFAACSKSDRLIAGTSPNRVAVAAVKATDIVAWEGIEDRRLFSLNVRGELRRNRVSRQLDGAISRADEHPDFLAYHNGLTMVCEHFEDEAGRFKVDKPSIVNGTQSVLAFFRGEAEGELTKDLRVFVKIVEVKDRPQLAKDVSWRSNTQTAVNARNLMALGGPQARIAKEFAANYPTVYYETRPDASFKASDYDRVIANDDAAQLLCAVYNAWPWLAVKRLVLFESENHAEIFKDVTASQVFVVDVIREVIDDDVDHFPDRYRSSWRLTRLLAVYLVGQIIRGDDGLRPILDDPATALKDIDALKKSLVKPVRMVAFTLQTRIELLDAEQKKDEFNREFKNKETQQSLRDSARKTYRMAETLGQLESGEDESNA